MVFWSFANRDLYRCHEHGFRFNIDGKVESVDVLEERIIGNEKRSGVLVAYGKAIDNISVKCRGPYGFPMKLSVMQAKGFNSAETGLFYGASINGGISFG